MSYRHILDDVAHYYGTRLRDHGPNPQGVDWNSAESQILRFEQILKVCDFSTALSINDYGCGYGALVDYLTSSRVVFR